MSRPSSADYSLSIDGQAIPWPHGVEVGARVQAPRQSALFVRRGRAREEAAPVAAAHYRLAEVEEDEMLEDDAEPEPEACTSPRPGQTTCLAVEVLPDRMHEANSSEVLPATVTPDSSPCGEPNIKNISAEKAKAKAARINLFNKAVCATFERLQEDGIPLIPASSLTLGAEISRGAFGIVRDAVADIDGSAQLVAVKSLPLRMRKDSYAATLDDFETEVRMGWRASWKARAGKKNTRVLRIFGVAFDFIRRGQQARLRIVMERVNCDGDVHDEIHSENHWICLREQGKDTGVSVRNHFITVDGTDVWAYVMPRELKLRLGLDLARALRELERANVIHRDIKPSNMLLHQGEADRPGLLLKLMDFGEAAAADNAGGFAAGTPGYMAPEVEVEGASSPFVSLGLL